MNFSKTSCFIVTAICFVLYDKRFGLLNEKIDEEAINFITSVKTVSRQSYIINCCKQSKLSLYDDLFSILYSLSVLVDPSYHLINWLSRQREAHCTSFSKPVLQWFTEFTRAGYNHYTYWHSGRACAIGHVSEKQTNQQDLYKGLTE